MLACFLFSSRRRHTRWPRDWSSDVCSSDLHVAALPGGAGAEQPGEVAHGEDGELGVLRGGDGLRDAGGVGAEEVGARDGGDLRGRSEERRVGKGGRAGGAQELEKKEYM